MSRPQISPEVAVRAALRAGRRYVVACSGGVDSLVLLHLCCALRRELELTIVVAHVDHGLRDESGADAAFVAACAAEAGVEFELKQLAGRDAAGGQNIEGWARRERYRFFSTVIDTHHADAVLTAHTADDVAETFLMRLVSNKELRTVMGDDPGRRVIRPFLRVPKRALFEYAGEHGLRFCHDASNDDTDLLRNRVRHTLLPHLEQHFDPRIAEVLAQRAGDLDDDERAIDRWLCDSYPGVISAPVGNPRWGKYLVEALAELPEWARWRLVAVSFQALLKFRLSRLHSRDVVAVALGERRSKELPGGIVVALKDGTITITGG